MSKEEKLRIQQEFMAVAAKRTAAGQKPNGVGAPEQKKLKAAEAAPVARAAPAANPNRDALINAFESTGPATIRVGPLNTLIGALYTSAADRAGSVGLIAELDGVFGMRGAHRMESSASECDCLIHSFLTVTCPNFRKLTQRSKDEFASIFRRQMLPRLVTNYPVSEKTPNQIRQFIIDVIQSGRFLSDADSSIIAKLFDVNLLLLEPARGGQAPLAILISPRNGNVSDPYVIYGSGAHFEGVKLDGNVWQRNYAESVQSVADIMAGRRAVFHDVDSFSFGSRVTYKGKDYYVFDRIINPETQKTVSYHLSDDLKLLAQIIDIGVSEGLLSSLDDRFIRATAADVKALKGGYKKNISRRLRDNRRRKTRKYLKR